MEKILIKDNSFKAEQDVITLYDLVTELNETFVPGFKALSIGKLTTDLLRNSLSTDCNKVEIIIRKQSEKDVKAISTVAIKKAILSNVEPLIEEFKLIAYKFRKNDINRFIEYLEVVDENIFYSSNTLETIREKAKYYIDDPKEIEVYTELKAVSDAYNRLLEKVGDKCKMSLRINGISHFLDIHPTTYKSEPCERLDYSLMLK